MACAAHCIAPVWLNGGWSWPTRDLGMARVLFSFPLGVVLWRVAADGRGEGGQRAPRTSGVALLAVLAEAVLMLVPVAEPLHGAYDMVCIFLAFPALLLCGIVYELPAMLRRPFAFLGEISYAVYAIHYPLVGLAHLVAAHLHMGAAMGTALFIPGIIGLAFCVTRWVDVPMRRWLTAKLKPRAPVLDTRLSRAT